MTREEILALIRIELLTDDGAGNERFSNAYLDAVERLVGNHGTIQFLLNRYEEQARKEVELEARLQALEEAAFKATRKTESQVGFEVGVQRAFFPSTVLRDVRDAALRILDAYGPENAFVRKENGDLIIDLEGVLRHAPQIKIPPAMVHKQLKDTRHTRHVLRSDHKHYLGEGPPRRWVMRLLGMDPLYNRMDTDG